MNVKNQIACVLAGVAGIACGAAHAQQAYPTKFVRFIVTYPPGGSSDVMARIIGAQLTEYWRQSVIVESRPGADGSIGSSSLPACRVSSRLLRPMTWCSYFRGDPWLAIIRICAAHSSELVSTAPASP